MINHNEMQALVGNGWTMFHFVPIFMAAFGVCNPTELGKGEETNPQGPLMVDDSGSSDSD